MISVKVCGLRDPLNIQAIAGAKPDFLGFIFYPGSKRYVGKDPKRSTFSGVTAEIPKVGVFVNEKPDNILELSNRLGLQLVQLHGNEPADHCHTLRSAGLQIIKTFGVQPDFDFNCLVPYLPVCDYFLFDTKSNQLGGSGLKFNWDLLKHYSFNVPFFLSGGIGPNDAGIIRKLQHPAFYAVDINSLFEIEPGMKEPDKIKSFIQEIKTLEP